MLAVCVLREQGCQVEAVVFDSPFFNTDQARRSAEAIGVTLHVPDFTADITGLLDNPRHGFGRTMNPCIDCHALMIRRAGEIVREKGWNFVATGEVLNQRPMSQNRHSLAIVASTSGCAEILVRPLSALLLDETRPEREGLIDRSRLLALSGRGRSAQIALAEKFGIGTFPAPAGGCLLTEGLFCSKLRDLQLHEGLENRRDLRWLRLGRHFRLPDGAKCIAGRDAEDNDRLQREAGPGNIVLHPVAVPGPTVVLPLAASAADAARAAAICAGYCDAHGGGSVRLARERGGVREEIEVEPMARAEARAWLLTAR